VPRRTIGVDEARPPGSFDAGHADNLLHNLTTTIPGFTTSQAIFNLDATANGSAAIAATDQFGNVFNFNLTLSGTGQSFFQLTGINGERISGVSITTTVGLEEVSQIRFGELTQAGTPTQVPGPVAGAGLPGLVLAGGALFGCLRRLARRERQHRGRLHAAPGGRHRRPDGGAGRRSRALPQRRPRLDRRGRAGSGRCAARRAPGSHAPEPRLLAVHVGLYLHAQGRDGQSRQSPRQSRYDPRRPWQHAALDA
jgi:hypothetical protein